MGTVQQFTYRTSCITRSIKKMWLISPVFGLVSAKVPLWSLLGVCIYQCYKVLLCVSVMSYLFVYVWIVFRARSTSQGNWRKFTWYSNAMRRTTIFSRLAYDNWYEFLGVFVCTVNFNAHYSTHLTNASMSVWVVIFILLSFDLHAIVL